MPLENFVRALQAYCRRMPFQPFRVELVSRDAFMVVHPEALSLRGEVAIYTNRDGRHRLFDSQSVCQLSDSAPE